MDWMCSYLAPWEPADCAIYKYQHVGSKRYWEWMILHLESIDMKDIMGHVAFLRLTKHLDHYWQVFCNLIAWVSFRTWGGLTVYRV